MLSRLRLTLLLLVLGSLRMMAQYDVNFAHYWALEPYYNPAAVGKASVLNVSAAYAMDLAGFEHNPQTMYIGADMPFQIGKILNGGGVSYMNDKIGLFTHQRLALQYAYRQKLLKGQLAIGVNAGFLSENFNGSKLDPEDGGDPALPKADVNGNSVDLGVGLYYTRGPWYVGVSAQHINSPKVELGETNELQIDAAYYLTGGYNIKLRNPFLSIQPSFLVRTDGTNTRGDVGARLTYNSEKRILYGGLSYSPDNSVTVLVGGSFHGVKVGYSYEIYTTGLNPGNGSHELFVSYQTDINLAKKGKNLHKSVRLL